MANDGDVRGMSGEDLLNAYGRDIVAPVNPMLSSRLRTELLRRLSAGNAQAEKVQISNIESTYCMRDHVCCNALRDLLIAAERDVCVSGDLAERARTNMRKALDYRGAEPERSDGRIQAWAGPAPDDVDLAGRISDEAAAAGVQQVIETMPQSCDFFATPFGILPNRSGEQRETRIQGGERATYDAIGYGGVPSGRTEVCYMTPSCPCSRHEAQRSAGRVEAGSEQVRELHRYGIEPLIVGHDGIATRSQAECQDSENGAVTRDGGKIKP